MRLPLYFHCSVASLALGVALAATPAVASDYRWTGFYIGINGGGGWSNGGTVEVLTDDITPVNLGDSTAASRGTIGNIGDTGFGNVGAQFGYNHQFGRFVLGGEADIQFSGLSETVTGTFTNPNGLEPVAGEANLDLDWFGTLRARFGFLLTDQLLAYVTGGWAFGDVKYRLDVVEPRIGTQLFEAHMSDSARSGYVLGGGIEYAFNSNISLKIEYQYLNFGSLEGSAPVTRLAGGALTGETASARAIDADIHTARIGLNYKFGREERYETLK